MGKEERTFKIDYRLEWTYGVTIAELRKDLDEIEKLGATHVMIDSYAHYDMTYTSIEAVSERMETDEEFQERINEDLRRKEEIKQRELKQLEEIKSKYGL